ncbi:UNVERIFIED_CONTAM: hypothetical protein FKN15_071040 [Acipenser sinensis]
MTMTDRALCCRLLGALELLEVLWSSWFRDTVLRWPAEHKVHQGVELPPEHESRWHSPRGFLDGRLVGHQDQRLVPGSPYGELGGKGPVELLRQAITLYGAPSSGSSKDNGQISASY